VRSDLELALDAAADAAASAPDVETTFAALGLPDRLVTALARRGMTAPFAIQTRAIPDALSGRDVLGRGATGSARRWPSACRCCPAWSAASGCAAPPAAWCSCPTRELAQQVSDALAPLAQALDLKVTTVYGGASMGRQIDQLRRGVDVVVATPGRLQDLIDQRECTLEALQITVLDEADHMADLGFMPAVTALLDMTADGTQRLLFSATLDRGVDKLVRQYLVDPAVHAVASADSTVTTMDHRVYAVQGDAKVDISAEIAARPGRTLFFVRTKHGADRLAMQMRKVGVEAAAIHGNLTQHARKRALENFTTGPRPGAGRHRRRRPRHPRRRRRPGRALRPAGRPQGLPAPLGPHRPRGRQRHRPVAGHQRPGPRPPADARARRRRGQRRHRRDRPPGRARAGRVRRADRRGAARAVRPPPAGRAPPERRLPAAPDRHPEQQRRRSPWRRRSPAPRAHRLAAHRPAAHRPAAPRRAAHRPAAPHRAAPQPARVRPRRPPAAGRARAAARRARVAQPRGTFRR
jgi:hypothetical protein